MNNNIVDNNKYKCIENRICPLCSSILEIGYNIINNKSISNYRSNSNFIATKPIISIGYYYCNNCNETF